MRPNTSWSGIFRTNRSNPLRVSRLTKMFVPKPKNAFQSPGTQMAGFELFITFSSIIPISLLSLVGLVERSENSARVRYPAENPSLRLDHFESHLLELRKVRSHAVCGDQTVVTAIVGFADGGVNTDFGGHTSDDELMDTEVLKNRMQIGGEKCPFAGIVNHRFRQQWVEFRNNIMSRLAS